jgi:predicted metalloprotease
MRWESGRRSDNVEDRRGLGGPVLIGGGMGIGGLVLVLLMMLAGVDPSDILQPGPGGGPGPNLPDGGPQRHQVQRVDPGDDKLVDFTKVVLGSTEDVWRQEFQQRGRTYHPPKLVLFSGETDSGCGFASAAVGPFYCPRDRDVYLDLEFFQELRSRFHAPGDTAQAYVIAHEVGHHVQNEMGISDRVESARQQGGRRQANELSVRLELQADYLAGVWAHHAAKSNPDLFEPGDIEEALRGAASVGDDRLQMQAQGYVVPDAFTHGTSAQRLKWFRKGYETGDLKLLNYFFEADEL